MRLVAILVSACLVAFSAPAHANAPAAKPAAQAVPAPLAAAPAKKGLFGWLKKKDAVPDATDATEKMAAEIVQKYGNARPLGMKLAKLELSQKMTFGQKVAKRVTAFSGSWSYLIGGFTMISGWTYMGATGNHFFSPDVLNLTISIATWAVGTLLMMYQNQQARADRQRQDALLLLLMQTEKESRHAENQLKTAQASNRELKASVGEMQLKLDKLVEMMQPAKSAAP